GGKVDLLVIIGGNPVYTAPADLRFADALGKAQLRVHLSLYEDETSALSHWQIPETHFLETWSDARAYDGTVSIVQPLIAPLYGGKSAHELLAAMSDKPERPGHDIVQEYWRKEPGGAPFDADWGRAAGRGRWGAMAAGGPGGRFGRAGQGGNAARQRCRAGRTRSGQRIRSVFPPRPVGARRTVCEQRLAAGAAQADQPADVGQRG